MLRLLRFLFFPPLPRLVVVPVQVDLIAPMLRRVAQREAREAMAARLAASGRGRRFD